jgi:hypothetical protein
MTEDEVRDRAAVAIFPAMLQMNTSVSQGLAGSAPKVEADPGRAAIMAYQAAEALVMARRISIQKRAVTPALDA